MKNGMRWHAISLTCAIVYVEKLEEFNRSLQNESPERRDWVKKS